MDKFFVSPEKLLKRILYLVLTIFLGIYAYFQIVPGKSTNITTEAALAVTLDNSFETDGYIFRNETVIPLDRATSVVSTVSDGDRVTMGDAVANVYYRDYDSDIQERIDEIDREIDILTKSSNGNTFAVGDIDKIDSDIASSLKTMYRSVGENNFSEALESRDKLLVLMNRRKMATDSYSSFDDKISALQNERNALSSNFSDSSKHIYAPLSGYYMTEVDGLEEDFNTDTLSELTVEKFLELEKKCSDAEITSKTAGKIVKDFEWFTVCRTDVKSSQKYNVGSYYTIRFPYSSNTVLKMELVRIVSDNAEDISLLVFRSNVMPENFNYLRKQKIEIVNSTLTGLKIPKGSLRILDGQNGVYVLVGDIVEFRRANVIYEDGEYFLIDMDKAAYAFEEDETSSYKQLSLYDYVITSGKDLYDGKIIE